MNCLPAALGLAFWLVLPAAWSQDEPAKEEREQREGREQRERVMEISCRDEQGRPESWLDRSHSYLSQRLCEPAAWFDGFFGDPRSLEETPVGTFFRLRNAAVWDETEGWKHRVQVRANISLPRLSDKVRLLIARDEDLEGDFQDSPRFDDNENRTRLGLRILASERARSRFDIDGTVRLSSGALNPRVRGRYRYVRGLTDRTLGRLTQTTFWEREDGFGTSTRLDWEWLPDRNRLVRWTGRGTFSEASKGVDWQSTLVGFRQLDNRTAISAEAGAFGFTRPSFQTEEYYTAFRFRRQFLRHWLFYEIQPEHAWPKDFETGQRRRDWRLTLTLEIQFENRRSRHRRLERYLEEEKEEIEKWEDRPIPVDAPGDRAEDPVLEDEDDENTECERKDEDCADTDDG